MSSWLRMLRCSLHNLLVYRDPGHLAKEAWAKADPYGSQFAQCRPLGNFFWEGLPFRESTNQQRMPYMSHGHWAFE